MPLDKDGKPICDECKTVHQIGCMATGANSCHVERKLCDCGAIKRHVTLPNINAIFRFGGGCE